MIVCVGKKDDKANRKLLVISSESGELLREFDIGPLKLTAFRLSWTSDSGAIRYAASNAGGSSIYRQPLAGGAPEKMIELNENDIFDFSYSPDGRQLAATRGDWQFDIVLLSGLNQ